MPKQPEATIEPLFQKPEIPLENQSSEQLQNQLLKDKALAEDLQKILNDLYDSFETSSTGVQQISIDKKYIAEVKSYKSPPSPVFTVASCVMIIIEKKQEWKDIIECMSDRNFMENIRQAQVENVS